MSDVRVFTEREVAAAIEATLAPMLDGYREQAQRLGGGFEVQVDRAQHIGAAHGVIEALVQLLPQFGSVWCPDRSVEPPLAPAPRTVGSPETGIRMRGNQGRHAERWSP